jgi:hypothetical protein
MGRLSHIVRQLYWLPLVNLPVMFPLTLRHYYPFGELGGLLKNGELASPESWDALRLNDPNLFISDERAEWIKGLTEVKDGQDLALRERASEIVGLLDAKGIADIHSVGVGAGALEYFIKLFSASAIRVVASDYNPEGVARLRRVFVECDGIEQFDITQDNWLSVARASTVLMYRVDPQLSDQEWRAVFESTARARIQNILYIPSNEISFQYLMFSWLRTLFARMAGKRLAFAGYIRSAKIFPKFWQGLYVQESVRLGGLRSYWLTLHIGDGDN